jgi:hypothetical protein
MSRKNKALVLVVFLFVCAATIGGCSASLDPDANSHLVAADDGGEEEVLDQDDDDDSFGRPENSTPPGTAGRILVSVGYLAMMIGSAVLPLLMFL